MLRLNVEKLNQEMKACDVFRTVGKLRSAGSVLLGTAPGAVGDLCQVTSADGTLVPAEVIGFDRGLTQLMPYRACAGIQPNAEMVCLRRPLKVPVGDALLGRVINGIGEAIDEKGPLNCTSWTQVTRPAPSPLTRPLIDKALATGQRAIDGLLTLGRGQRVALFAGSGIGKSTLLGEMGRAAESDLNVIALIGERGREVRPFLEECLGQDGLSRSVVIVSTSDQPPLARLRAGQAAVAVADHFRARGADVLLLLDSVTRMAMAQREIGLQLGEPPSARGYTPSVFQMLASSLEQLGATETGTITGILTVLVDGDDMDDPIADAVRSITDGHIVLDRRLAEKGHYPAIDIGRSISRVFREVNSEAHQLDAQKLRSILATYAETEDLIRIGAYVRGTSPAVDHAIEIMPRVLQFLQQPVGTHVRLPDTLRLLAELAAAGASPVAGAAVRAEAQAGSL